MKYKLFPLLFAASLLFLTACGSQSQQQTPQEPAFTEADAQAAALEHAGLTESDVTFVRTTQDRDNGRKVYDVEFYTKDFVEYDYEFDATTGEMLSFDQDADGFAPPAPTNDPAVNPGTNPGTDANGITKEQAMEIALAQVPGATQQGIREFKLEHDDGRTAYEGTIVYERVEYEFQIDATTGNIVEWESESVFD